MNELNWEPGYDEHGNSMWEAASFWEEGFEFRITKKLEADKVVYTLENSCSELIGDALKRDLDFPTLKKAQAAAETMNREMLELVQVG